MVFKTLSLHLVLFGYVFSKVEWYIQSPKVVLGGNVTLFCNTSLVKYACEDCPASWFGGKNLTLLSIDRFTASDSKYSLTKATDGFGITIKNLSETDLHVPYICSFGFHSFEGNLTLDDRFEYQPSKAKIDTTHQITDKSMLNFYVNIEKVHPVPFCTAMFNHENVTSGLKPTIRRNGPFYRASYHLELDIKNHLCKGRLQMHCSIGSNNLRLIDTYINYTCYDDKIKEETTERDDNLVLLVLLLLVLFAVCYFCYNIKQVKYRILKFKLLVQSVCIGEETEEKTVYLDRSCNLPSVEETKLTKNFEHIDGKKKLNFADEAEDQCSDLEIKTHIDETTFNRNNSEIINLCENRQNLLGTTSNDTQQSKHLGDSISYDVTHGIGTTERYTTF